MFERIRQLIKDIGIVFTPVIEYKEYIFEVTLNTGKVIRLEREFAYIYGDEWGYDISQKEQALDYQINLAQNGVFDGDTFHTPASIQKIKLQEKVEVDACDHAAEQSDEEE